MIAGIAGLLLEKRQIIVRDFCRARKRKMKKKNKEIEEAESRSEQGYIQLDKDTFKIVTVRYHYAGEVIVLDKIEGDIMTTDKSRPAAQEGEIDIVTPEQLETMWDITDEKDFLGKMQLSPLHDVEIDPYRVVYPAPYHEEEYYVPVPCPPLDCEQQCKVPECVQAQENRRG